MHGWILAAVLAVSAPRTDTTLAVPSGAKLSLENFAGQIEVDTWSRNSLRVQAEHGRRTHIEVSEEGGEVTVSVETDRGGPGSVDFHLTVPTSMSLSLSGVYCDIRATGLKGGLEAETVQGDIEVKGGTGRVSASSVQGSVIVEDASGQVEVSSVNEGVHVSRVKGDLTAESVNGSVIVKDSQLHSLEASTVNGTISYDGSYARDGHYEMSSHNGSIFAAIPENADINVRIETYNGTFESTFPVKRQTDGHNKRRYNLTFGSGGAEMTLESFQGLVTLHRPGEKMAERSDFSDEDTKDKTKEKDKATHRPKDKDKGDDEE